MLLGVGVARSWARKGARNGWRAVAGMAAALAALPGTAGAAASAWSDHDVVDVRLIAAAPDPNGSPRLGLHFRLAPEWHVYWRHPGDAGAPPQVSLAFIVHGAAGNAIVPDVLFPAPRRFRLPGGLEALGYDGEVVYPLRLAVAPSAASGLTAAIDYVACAIECIPFHDDLELETLPAVGAAPTPEDELMRHWEARLPREPAAIGIEARLRYSAGDAPELELELTPPPAAPSAVGDGGGAATIGGEGHHAGDATVGGGPELFLEPAPGATFASPERVAGGAGIRFRAAVRPEVVGQPPRELRVAWTVTGVPIGAGVAVAGVASVPAGGEVGSGVNRSPRAHSEATSSRTSGRGQAVPAAALAALLALVLLLTALALWFLPARLATVPPATLRVFGFVVATGLVWSAYRLAALLPTVRIAAVELSWLAVALGVRCATTTAGARRRVWLALALAAAAAGVWAAWSPAMLSP
jgi:DsbC/DsbD-like thiol-disulfide interchange protein